MSSPNSSGTTTPTSTRSSVSCGSNASSSSTSTSSGLKASSMKSSLKSTSFPGVNVNRRSSPPTVRFSDPEPVSRQRQNPIQNQQNSHPQRSGIPNSLLRYPHRPAISISGSALSRNSAYSTLPPRGGATPHSEQIQYTKIRAGQRFSAPVQPSRPDPRWSGVPLPANFTPPSLALEHRVSSFHSIASNASIQSAPPALQTLPNGSPSSPYNPLRHYIPCLYVSCKVHYSSTHIEPSYYLPQAPYSIPRHYGYCQHHAAKELKEASTLCRRTWESLRQNAGRKTLGQIAAEFESFLDAFRQERKLVDAELQRRQKRIVLGTAKSTAKTNTQAAKQPDDTVWIWAYTPRQCTRATCPSDPYSPFANHLYAFYNTPHPLNFTPQPTFCPSCAKKEVEALECSVMQKWNSRCGWDEDEWNAWFENMVQDRNMEFEFWEKAQERVVRERGPSRWVERLTAEQAVEESKTEKKNVDKRKSAFKRWFGSTT
ncbi:hypothetical protein GQ44DRAFT_607079 [Phaeosphaeriaceae sp. PMI808]|nr:hypothetical protein GQ44DRAFT_607079 [Phaeosphaeriaceae sp. PMI808]